MVQALSRLTSEQSPKGGRLPETWLRGLLQESYNWYQIQPVSLWSLAIKSQGRITTKIKLFLFRTTDAVWSISKGCHLSPQRLCNSPADCVLYRYIPHASVSTVDTVLSLKNIAVSLRYFPFPVQSHQTILHFSPAWILPQWPDNYFFPKNQRTPNAQQSAGPQRGSGRLRDLHQCIHRCLFQLPKVCRFFPNGCSEEPCEHEQLKF